MADINTYLKLSLDDIKKQPKDKQIEILEKLVHYHNVKYFIDNDPIISDEEFDRLTEELRKLKPDSPVLYEIVGEIGEIKHPTPMLSIDKRYSYNEIKKWVESIDTDEFIVEPKYDGMAARYQNGILATRGNGIYGEDISGRLPYLKIIGELPKDPNVSVRGEIIIPNSYFQKHLAGEYKNPRNAVVGIIKAKQIKPAGIKALQDGGVHFVIYDEAKSLKVKKKDILDEEKWEQILESVLNVDYPLDGVVIKVADEKLREKLGATEHHERWQIAYKFPAEKKITTVVDIKDQVGRTGRITGVAVVEPVELSGATITNVTLHNYDFIEKSKIDIGCKVEICRAGEVIPFITKVFAKPEGEPRIYKIPTHCPICGTPVVKNGKYLECPNKGCPARKSQEFEYFFKSLGVENLGLKTIEKFINEFHIQKVTDFYDLKPEQIAKLEGFGSKSAQKIVQNIQNTLNGTITESQLLQALGIKEIGPATSKLLVKKIGFDRLPHATAEEIIETVEGMGPKKAEYLLKEIKDKWKIVEDLKKRGLKFKKEETTDKLAGLKFAITGKKGRYSRDELAKMIEQNGGEYKTSVTKDLDYLIAGPDAGSKLQKAKELGVKVINEDEFLEMIK